MRAVEIVYRVRDLEIFDENSPISEPKPSMAIGCCKDVAMYMRVSVDTWYALFQLYLDD